MTIARPFAFNTGSTIPDMFQSGDLAIGPLTGSTRRYDLDYGGVKWYMGANETLGYIIGRPVPSTEKPSFFRAPFTEQGYLDLANYVYLKYGGGVTPFNNTLDAKNWINSEGYWQTYTGGTGPSPTPTASVSPTPSQSTLPATPTPTPSISITPTPTPTPSVSAGPNPNSFKMDFSGTTVYNLLAGNSFAPEDNSEWDFGDGNTDTTVNANVNHTYVDPYLEPESKTIQFTTDDLTKLTALGISGMNPSTLIDKVYAVDFSNVTKTTIFQISSTEINSLDISTFTGITGSIIINNNPQLRELNLPTQNISSGYVSVLNIYSNAVLPKIDFSGLNRIASRIEIYSNSSLESITFPQVPDTVGNITSLEIRSNPNITDIDVSGLTRIGVDIELQSNSSLTGITFPSTIHTSASDIRRLDLFSNNLTGHLDLSMFDKLGGYVQMYLNPNLTGVTFASTLQAVSDPINTFRLDRCNLQGTLDLSMFTKMGRTILIYSNPLLTGITFAPTLNSAAVNISNMTIYGCALSELDLSMFTKLGGSIQIGYDSTLTNHIQTLTFPSSIDSGASNFTSIDLRHMSELKELDISSFTKFGGTINIQSLPMLTGITFPSSVTGNNITTYYGYSNPELLEMNITGLTKIGGIFNIGSCSKLQSITFAPTIDAGATNIVSFGLHSCDLRGNVDVSMFTKIGGTFMADSNASLTGITFTNSLNSGAGNLRNIKVQNCDLRSLDLTGLVKSRNTWQSNGTQSFTFSNNPNLTSVQFPSVETGSTLLYMVNRIYFSDCSLDQTSVDDLFAKMLEYYNVVTPVGGTVVVNLDNPNVGNNSLPSTQGYSDISDLETIFTNAGLTLTITLNT